MKLKEIRELKTYLVDVYHKKRIQEQEKDQTYIDDTFNVPFLKEGVDAIRTGRGYRMVSAPAEHIITDNPQVFRSLKRKGASDAANDRVTSELNRQARILLSQNPQPYKEFVKKLLGRGEAYIYITHNNDYNKEDEGDLPVSFTILDPLIVFPDVGEKNGIPSRFIISYERIVSDIKRIYPYWTWKNRKSGMTEQDKVPFWIYFDDKIRYFEAAEESLLTDAKGRPANGSGVQENIYGLVPLVHAYSGFGEGSPDGDPSSLAVGRLRKVRDLIGEYTAIKSTINYIIFQYAHPVIDITYDPTTTTIPSDMSEKYSREPNSINMLPIGPGGKRERSIDMLPDQELYQYLAKLEYDIDREDPLGEIGQAIGTSGRQQDIATTSALRRYDTVVENCAHAFATAFGIVLRILERLPHLMPPGIKEGDINSYYDCKVELKAQDPLDQDRLRTLGERLYLNGQIDLETNLTKYQGYTTEEAQNIMAKILVDNATRNNPIIAQIMGEQAAREIGMEQQYQTLKAQAGMMETTPKPVPQIGSQGGEPRVGNIKSPTGQEMMDMSLAQRGQRRPPSGG